jgi:glycosyltransferase involved in cell wall biosynthesis
MPAPATHKIVHATECLAAGTLAFLVQATRELARAGVRQVLVFSRRPDTPANVESLFDPRVQLVEIAPPGDGYLRYAMALRRALLRHLQGLEETCIHLHSSKAGFVGRLMLVGLRSRPTVFYSPHGLSFLNRRFLLPSLSFRALEWLAARVDSQLVGCSSSEARLLDDLGRRPALVLENAVDDSFFRIQREASPLPLVVSMGRVCYQKAPEVFAAMATRFKIAEVPARFVWIGSGDPAGEARLRAAGVEVTGWIDRAGVQRLLGQAAVYVQTSRWEGMPLSVLQALAAGVPCVVSNAVGNRDAVRQGLTGFVVNRLGEGLVCLRRLLVDAELNERFSKAARDDASKRFSSASFRARLLRLYRFDPQVAADAGIHPVQPASVTRLHSVDKPRPEAAPDPREVARTRPGAPPWPRRVAND